MIHNKLWCVVGKEKNLFMSLKLSWPLTIKILRYKEVRIGQTGKKKKARQI
jgi:hypothetical protein